MLARRAAVEKTGLKPEEIGVAFITPCPAKVTAAKVPLGNQTRNIDAAIAISRVYPQLVQEVKKDGAARVRASFPHGQHRS